LANKQTYKGKIVEQYLKKFPKASTNAIARMLIKDYPIEFKETNSRTLVRNYRGENKNLKSIDTSQYERSEKTKKEFMGKKFNLPDSDYEVIEPFIIASKNVLILSDIHMPYHDKKALRLALEYGVKHNMTAIYLNGDILDCYMVSNFVRDRRKRDMADELEMGRNFLKSLRDNFDGPIFYKWGNHEERWENFLKLNAPELLGISDFELSSILRFGEHSIQEVKSRQIAYMGKLAVLHGHEFGRSTFSPVNAARGLYMKTKESCIVGHHHQTSEHTEKSLSNEVVTTWSTGCLSGLNPDYNMYGNKYNHGFAFVKVGKDGNYQVDNIRIIDYKIV